ncbi:hypothetical protein ACSAGD_10775 [Paramicrobacterium sp. CJ85]|uniref:hypothetical protein n=1 Tax=Paramicrobacterium sp. CJ85 TaxID=3445355 RepID=UPI003F5FDA40
MAANTDAEIRRKYARLLMGCIARNNLHSILTVKDSDGATPIVIALGHEKVDAVFQRIKHAGGSANLVIVDSSEDVHLITMVPASHAAPTFDEPNDPADLHKNITMDFLVHYMQRQADGKETFRISFTGVNLDASRNSAELASVL